MTTSETGDLGGFTLLEILLALALVALLGTIFIGASQAMLSDKAKGLDEQFWLMCTAARKQALEDRRSVVVAYDQKTKGFIFSEGAGRLSVPVTGPEDLAIDFHPAQLSSISESLVGGTAVETGPITSVTFYNDGTCTPFRAQIRANGGAHTLAVDPWTCAPVISSSDAKP
jgi:prepilin-type N-terminal cleavage/methylation domain-containing protein